MVELIPVLEMEPGTYRTRERPLPTQSGAENPQAWVQYWRESLADSGIVNLEPLSVGYYLVALDDLKDSATIRIIATREIGLDGFTPQALTRDPDQWSALYGGYVLSKDDVSIEPTCCGRLYDLENWASAAAHRSPEWEMVWIGHPWTGVRYVAGSLRFCEHFETSPADGLREVMSVAPDELEAAISRAEAGVMAFRERLRAVLADLLPDKETAAWLAERWTATRDLDAPANAGE